MNAVQAEIRLVSRLAMKVEAFYDSCIHDFCAASILDI